MATVNVMENKRTQSRAGLAFLLSYCKRDSKTIHEGKKLVSGINCLPESACREFMNTMLQYGKTDGRMFYHFTQSFSPTEDITPETAHEIAVKFAQKMFPGFEILVATHTDKAHIHSHFVVNSVSCENGYKYYSDNENIERLRAASDKLCLQYGLSVVTPREQSQKVKVMSSREYRAAECGESAYQESRNRRSLYGDNGRKLEGADRRNEYADRYALGDTDITGRSGDQREYHLVYESADRDTDRVCAEQSGVDRAVHGDDGADDGSIYREDECGNREYVLTGWESERELFTVSLFGTGNGESVHQAEYADYAYTDSGADRLGTDTAYLLADLTNIIDEDAPVEDCTTMRHPQHRKKNNGPVMGGM